MPQRSQTNHIHQSMEDYARVRKSLEYIAAHWRRQPDVEEIAAHLGLSTAHMHVLFKRWAGLTPKAFLQALTLDRARALLRQNATVLETAYEVGLSSAGRLHDLFVCYEALSPGEYKNGGAGLRLSYGRHPSPFGEALLVAAPRGLVGLGWLEEGNEMLAIDDMRRRWPNADFIEQPENTAPLAQRVFDPHLWRQDRPLRIVLIGSNFEIRVWEILLRAPLGALVSYSAIAQSMQAPKATRAIGAAVGRNPLSFVVPCHRVVGKSGALTGYHWGLIRKQAIIGWEMGQTAST